jgi:hypothetical protein
VVTPDRQRWAHSPGLEINEVADGLVVYDPGRDTVHYLNNTAAALFTLCDGRRDEAAISEQYRALFGVEDEAGPRAGLDDLAQRGILTVEDA